MNRIKTSIGILVYGEPGYIRNKNLKILKLTENIDVYKRIIKSYEETNGFKLTQRLIILINIIKVKKNQNKKRRFIKKLEKINSQ